MSTLTIEVAAAKIKSVRTTRFELIVDLNDGRTISVPLGWFPRLSHGTKAERDNWELLGRGHGVTWPDLDEDISVECLLSGRPSGESQRSFAKWLENRKKKINKQLIGVVEAN